MSEVGQIAIPFCISLFVVWLVLAMFFVLARPRSASLTGYYACCATRSDYFAGSRSDSAVPEGKPQRERFLAFWHRPPSRI